MDHEELKTMYSRRTIRKFKHRFVPREITDEILSAGVTAPRAIRDPPWIFTIIEDLYTIAELAEKTIEICKEKEVDKVLELDLHPSMIFYNAPLLIFISGRKDYRWLKEDTCMCIQNMFLAAHSLGLNSSWVTFAKELNSSPEVLEKLGIDNNCEIVAPLIFGYPAVWGDTVPKHKVNITKWIK